MLNNIDKTALVLWGGGPPPVPQGVDDLFEDLCELMRVDVY